jgi:hypothetical protein
MDVRVVAKTQISSQVTTHENISLFDLIKD